MRARACVPFIRWIDLNVKKKMHIAALDGATFRDLDDGLALKNVSA